MEFIDGVLLNRLLEARRNAAADTSWLRASSGRCARQGPCGEYRASRPEARQCHDHQRGRSQGARFRIGRARNFRSRSGHQHSADSSRRGDGHALLHVPRAGHGRGRRLPLRHFFLRCDPLRNGCRPQAVSTGEDTPATLRQIIYKDPLPVEQSAPAEVTALLWKCLQETGRTATVYGGGRGDPVAVWGALDPALDPRRLHYCAPALVPHARLSRRSRRSRPGSGRLPALAHRPPKDRSNLPAVTRLVGRHAFPNSPCAPARCSPLR